MGGARTRPRSTDVLMVCEGASGRKHAHGQRVMAAAAPNRTRASRAGHTVAGPSLVSLSPSRCIMLSHSAMLRAACATWLRSS
jgi:hypothetical protein